MKTRHLQLVSLFAVISLVSACASDPSSMEFTKKGDIDIAQLQKEAELAYSFGRTGEAIFHYQEILKREPENIPALLAMGNIYLQLNEPDHAERFFQQVLNQQPMNLDAREGRALSWLKQGQYDEAVISFNNVLDEDENRWRSHNGLGVISDMRGDYQAAENRYKNAMAINTDNVSIMNNYGYSLIMSHKYAQAEDVLRDAMVLAGGNDARIANNLGIALAWQKKYKDAVNVASTAVELYVAYNNIGYIAYLNNDDDVAMQYYKEAIALSPRYYKKAEKNLELLTSRKK